MNFATTLLLCLVCSVFAFKVTKDRRSLTDVVSMGRKYRRHSKEVEASALELVVTESGNTALKLDAKGSKDYVAVHLSRKEARKFKAAFAASKGEPLSLSLHQYKIGGKKYYALFENHHDKYAPVDLEGVQEEKVKTICRTARSVAAALYFFSLLLYSVSFTVSVVLILAATGLIYINIPFLPDSAWDDACEFIKRPKEPSKSGNEETDVVPSAASIILQNIMDKYGTAEPEPEPVSVKPETPKKPEQKAESKTPEPTDVESIPDTPHQTKPEASNPAFKPKEVSLPTEPAKASNEPVLPVLDDVFLDTDEAADDTLALDAEIIDEDAEEVSLTADPEQDADAALVSIEQEAALASDDEDDAAALERELAALEATLPTPTTFDPSGIEEDEDDSESFDMDSWLAEDVPENEPDIETEIELETEEPELSVEPKQESAETDSEPPAKKEIAPKPAGMESDQNGKKDKTPSDTENPVKVNAFTKQRILCPWKKSLRLNKNLQKPQRRKRRKPQNLVLPNRLRHPPLLLRRNRKRITAMMLLCSAEGFKTEPRKVQAAVRRKQINSRNQNRIRKVSRCASMVFDTFLRRIPDLKPALAHSCERIIMEIG